MIKFCLTNFIGDWGLGIGDWPIPNPHCQSPILISNYNINKLFYKLLF